MSFLGKRPHNVDSRAEENDRVSRVATTESLRTVFISHLPLSYTNLNSITEAQRKIEDLLSGYIGPNNIQRVKILGEGRAKVVFKMAIWAKQILNVLNGVSLKNDEEWIKRQEKQEERSKKEQKQVEDEEDLEEEYEGSDFNRQIQSIVPISKNHFSKEEQSKSIIKKEGKKKSIDELRSVEYILKAIGHEEKLENTQNLENRSRDVVVKGIPKTLSLKEAEKKLTAWLGSIGVITNIRIPAKYNSVQDHAGYAFVTFNRPKHAEMAIEKKNGRMFEGAKLIIEQKMQREDYLKQKEESNNNPQFVVEVTQDDIDKRKKGEKERKLELQREEKERLEREKLERINKWREGGIVTKPTLTKENIANEKNDKNNKDRGNDKTIKEVQKSKIEDDKMSVSESESDSESEASIQGFDTDSEENEEPENNWRNIEVVKTIPEAQLKENQKSESTLKREEELNRTIFVRNIPVGATEEEVILLFSNYGRVSSAKLVINKKTNAPSGSGFVHFTDHEGYKKLFQAAKLTNILSNVERKADLKDKAKEFKKSIQYLPEKTQKRRLREFYNEQKNESSEKTSENFFTVDGLKLQSSQLYFARAMSRDTAKEKVIEKELEKARDKRKTYLASEGFIPKNSPAATGLPEAFLKKLEEKYIEKQSRLKSNPALHVNDRRLKVSYIPKSWDHKKFKSIVIKHVKEATGKSPKLTQVIILKDDKGKSKGMGFLEFESHDMALSALRELNNNPHIYKEGRLYLEFAIDDMVKIHKMKYKSASVQYDSGPVSKSRINRIVNKLEDRETMDRFSRVMGESSRPFNYKRKREDFDQTKSKRRRTES